jgi:hypothetical protein
MTRSLPVLLLLPFVPACAYGRYDGAYETRTYGTEVYEPYPQRVYFYEPADTRHVYWYERGHPDVVLYRPYFREGERAYYVERDAGRERRIYFDERDARLHRR